jgi:hypothetical protein
MPPKKKGGKKKSKKAPKVNVDLGLIRRQIVVTLHSSQLEAECVALEEENRRLEESLLQGRSAHMAEAKALEAELQKTEEGCEDSVKSLTDTHQEKVQLQEDYGVKLKEKSQRVKCAANDFNSTRQKYFESKRPLDEVRSRFDGTNENMKSHIDVLWTTLYELRDELDRVDVGIAKYRKSIEVDCDLRELPKPSDLFDKREVGRGKSNADARSTFRRQSRVSMHSGYQVDSSWKISQLLPSSIDSSLTPVDRTRRRTESCAESEMAETSIPALEPDDHFAEIRKSLKGRHYCEVSNFCLPLLIVRIIGKLHTQKIQEPVETKADEKKIRGRRSRIVRNLPKGFSENFKDLSLYRAKENSEMIRPVSPMDAILKGLLSAIDSMILSSLEGGIVPILVQTDAPHVVLRVMSESFCPEVHYCGTKVIWKMLGDGRVSKFMLGIGLSHLIKSLQTFAFSPTVNPTVVECLHSLLPVDFLDAVHTHAGDDEFDSILHETRGPGIARYRRYAVRILDDGLRVKMQSKSDMRDIHLLDPHSQHDYRKNAMNPEAAGVLGYSAHIGPSVKSGNRKGDAKDEVKMHVLRTRVQTIKALALKAMAEQAGIMGLVDHKVSDLNINRVVRAIFAALLFCVKETERWEKVEKERNELGDGEKTETNENPRESQNGDTKTTHTVKEVHAVTCHYLCEILVKLIVKDSAFYVIDIVNQPKRIIVLVKVLETFSDFTYVAVSCIRCWCFLLTSRNISKSMIHELGLSSIIHASVKAAKTDASRSLVSVSTPVLEFFGQSNLSRRNQALERQNSSRESVLVPNAREVLLQSDLANTYPESFSEKEEGEQFSDEDGEILHRPTRKGPIFSKSDSVPGLHQKIGLSKSNLMSRSAMFPTLSPLT